MTESDSPPTCTVENIPESKMTQDEVETFANDLFDTVQNAIEQEKTQPIIVVDKTDDPLIIEYSKSNWDKYHNHQRLMMIFDQWIVDYNKLSDSHMNYLVYPELSFREILIFLRSIIKVSWVTGLYMYVDEKLISAGETVEQVSRRASVANKILILHVKAENTFG